VKAETHHDTGDLTLYAANGDPLLKFQGEGPFLLIYGSHVLDARAEGLTSEALAAIEQWCQSARARLKDGGER
jgi:hypothetical protein